MTQINLTPIVIDGKTYIEIPNEEVYKMVVLGVNKVLKTRQSARKAYLKKKREAEILKSKESIKEPVKEIVVKPKKPLQKKIRGRKSFLDDTIIVPKSFERQSESSSV